MQSSQNPQPQVSDPQAGGYHNRNVPLRSNGSDQLQEDKPPSRLARKISGASIREGWGAVGN